MVVQRNGLMLERHNSILNYSGHTPIVKEKEITYLKAFNRRRKIFRFT